MSIAMKGQVKALAFYLPQFHPVKENSEWWGSGFTEWTNVVRAKPNFIGHYQPHIPRDLGFYDLRILDVMRQQAQLAQDHGLYGFCFYHYWFNGRTILEQPLNQYLRSDIPFRFCYCWANENWTRAWDGMENEVLLCQKHNPDDDRRYLESLVPVFKDPRYVKIDGKPLLLVYRVDLFPNAVQTANLWRQIAVDAGFPGMYLCAVQFYGIDDPAKFGFDAAVEFPPHNFLGSENRLDVCPQMLNGNFAGGIVDYKKVIAQSFTRERPSYTLYRGIVPSWDNTPRRQDTPHILFNSSPMHYRVWLQYFVDYTVRNHPENSRFLFINAWNEWGEGAHLEPDLLYRSAYLDETAKAIFGQTIGLDLLFGDDALLGFLARNLSGVELERLRAYSQLEMARILSTKRLPPRSKVATKLAQWLSKHWPSAFRAARAIHRVVR